MRLAYFLTLLLGCLSLSANAGFIRWDNHRDYRVNFDGTDGFVEENFNAIADGTLLRGQTINGITYLAPGDIAIGTNPDNRVRVGISNTLTNGIDGFTNQTLHIQFSRPVSTFGILAYEDHLGSSGRSTWDLLVSNNNDGVALFSTQITDTPSMTWNSVFLGISQTSATDFRFLRTFSDFNTPWSLFEITYVLADDTDAVSEPSTIFLAGVLMGFCGLYRRQSGSRNIKVHLHHNGAKRGS